MPAWCAGLLLAIPFVVCGDQIKVYRVAKERPTELAQQSLPAGHAAMPTASVSAQPRLTWKTPDGWTEVKPGEMRVASFNIKGPDGKLADVSVIPLPGRAGGDFANVNRWRSQVGLAAVSETEMKKLAQPVEIASKPADLYEQAGKIPASGDPGRILGVIQIREGDAWFFKMTGDDELVAQQKVAFVEFLKSVKFNASDASGLPPSHPPIDGASLPPGHPEISASSVQAGEISSEGKPHWQVPAGWKEIPGGQFLLAKFMIAGDAGAQAAINVSTSAGDGGGLAANVNRWRGQLGLPPAGEAELQKATTALKTAGGKATLVELAGKDARTGQPTKLVGAILAREGQIWFYKLMGDAKVVDGQKEAFTKFVKDAKY